MREQRIPPAFWYDLPVLAAVVLSWTTVSIAWAHILLSVALVAVIVLHLVTRRRRVRQLVTAPRKASRLLWNIGHVSLLLVALAVTITGVLRWVGVPREDAWHGGISYALLGMVVTHMWFIRRALWNRLTRRKSPVAR